MFWPSSVLFSSRHPKNVQNKNKIPLLGNCWNWHGGQFWVAKNDFRHKNAGDKWPNLTTLSLLLRGIFWCHISKSRSATKVKLCIRNAFMTHALFHSNKLMLTLILASGPLSPPLPQAKWMTRLGLIGLTNISCVKWKAKTNYYQMLVADLSHVQNHSVRRNFQIAYYGLC